MIRIGKYVFASEEERKADYVKRVGVPRIPRTNRVERPVNWSFNDWSEWLRLRYLERL